MKGPLKIITYEDHWERLVLPDGKNLGYVEAMFVRENIRRGPSYVWELRNSGLKFTKETYRRLIKKGMIEREKSDANIKRLVPTSYGREIISELQRGGLLPEYDKI